jgi:hypothetical protein
MCDFTQCILAHKTFRLRPKDPRHLICATLLCSRVYKQRSRCRYKNALWVPLDYLCVAISHWPSLLAAYRTSQRSTNLNEHPTATGLKAKASFASISTTQISKAYMSIATQTVALSLGCVYKFMVFYHCWELHNSTQLCTT